MSNLLKKIKALYGKLRPYSLSYAKVGLRPARDWHIILTISFLLLFVSATIAFYFYSQIDKGGLFVVTTNKKKSEVNIDNILLKKIVDEVNLRKANASIVNQNKIHIPDPSL